MEVQMRGTLSRFFNNCKYTSHNMLSLCRFWISEQLKELLNDKEYPSENTVIIYSGEIIVSLTNTEKANGHLQCG